MPVEDPSAYGPLCKHICHVVQQGKYPANMVSVNKAFYWHRMLLEDAGHGQPVAEVALSGYMSLSSLNPHMK